MNIIIPPRTVAFLRNIVALAIAVPVSYWLGTDLGFLYGLYMPFLLVFCMPWVVMIAPKQEVLIGFFMATLAWAHFAITDHRRSFDEPSWQWLADDAVMWAFTLVLSLIVTIPIYQWRKSRRRQHRG